MRLSNTGWETPRPRLLTAWTGAAQATPATAPEPTGGTIAAVQAPALPTLTRQPAWTTVPNQADWLSAGKAWSAESWNNVRGYLARMGLGQSPASQALSGGGAPSYTRRVVELVNRERSIRGLPPLTEKFGLSWVAQKRSTDMIVRSYFAHTDPDGHDPFWHLRAQGLSYRTAGENIAMGQRTPEDVVQGWMNSPGHRANILNPNFGAIGVGAVQNSQTGQVYWTQVFTD